MKDFCPKIDMLKKNPAMNYGSLKSAENVLSKSIFNIKNRRNYFTKKKSFQDINLGDHFLKKKRIKLQFLNPSIF